MLNGTDFDDHKVTEAAHCTILQIKKIIESCIVLKNMVRGGDVISTVSGIDTLCFFGLLYSI